MGDEQRKNVVVVGAGASQEFGLPTGAGLTENLKTQLSYEVDRHGNVERRCGDPALFRAIQLLANQEKKSGSYLFNLASQIGRNMVLAPSIDNYLDTHRTDEDLVKVGKLAIANAIIKAEYDSSLKIDETNLYNRLNFDAISETWAAVFFKLIAAKRDFESFLKALANITFISFNYDRCIKQFFANAATSYFQLNADGTKIVLDVLDVIHPYGSIGEIQPAFGRTTGYAIEPHPENILIASKRIRTFTEGVADVNLSADIKMAFDEAEIVIFLGFSFIDINMEILRLSVSRATKIKRVLATAKGRSQDTKLRLATQIANKYMYRSATDCVEMFDGKCFELFYEYDHYLMRAQPE